MKRSITIMLLAAGLSACYEPLEAPKDKLPSEHAAIECFHFDGAVSPEDYPLPDAEAILNVLIFRTREIDERTYMLTVGVKSEVRSGPGYFGARTTGDVITVSSPCDFEISSYLVSVYWNTDDSYILREVFEP